MKENELTIIELTNETIESMIYKIRGQKVMLDSDLARIYGYTTKAFNRIVESNNRTGYLVVNNFKVSKEISEMLGVDNKMLLLISKGKLISINKDHGIKAEEFADVVKKSAFSPEAIVYDSTRESFQLYARLGDDSFRTVIEFGAVPAGMKNFKADILTTLFKNQHYENRIKSIEENKYPNLSIVYKKMRSGWTSIATDSSRSNISNNDNDVKDK